MDFGDLRIFKATGIQPAYWSGTPQGLSDAHSFIFNGGFDVARAKQNPLAAWAVRAGDVAAAVPEPATGLLVGLGVLALACARRARRRR
jgi:hypothetical protein